MTITTAKRAPLPRAAVTPPAHPDFIGRARARGELAELLCRHRLVTVLGPGGCGKTSLAAVVATDAAPGFELGARWADLARIADPAGVPAAVMDAIGVTDTRGVTPIERLATYLADRQMLLVLDDCDRVIDAVAKLCVALAERCPGLRILLTSREPLRLSDETVFRLPVLDLPPHGTSDPAAVLAGDAGLLFASRAAEARRGFVVDDDNAAAVAELCARLDGIPLAIELAAARVRSLRPADILTGLDQRFALLTGGAAGAHPHQQTLAASIEWSNALLGDVERVLLRRLAVFVGGFDLAAAQAVTPGGLLAADDVLVLLADLVDRSMVTFDGARYGMLTTIREFAAAALDAAGETSALRAAHLAHYSALAAALGEQLFRVPTAGVADAVDVDRANLRAGLDHALATGASESALCLVGDLAAFWQARGRYADALDWARTALAGTPDVPSPGRLRALFVVAQIGLFAMDVPGAWGTAELARALELAVPAGDDVVLGRASAIQGMLTAFGAPAAARSVLAGSLIAAERSGDPFAMLTTRAYAALAHIFGLDDPSGAAGYLTALDAAAEDHKDGFWAAWRGLVRGIAALRAGRLAEAVALLSAAGESASALGDPMLDSWCAVHLADAHLALDADEVAGEVVAVALAVQDPSAIARTEWLLLREVERHRRCGDLAVAHATLAAAEPGLRALAAPFGIVETCAASARLALASSDLATARAALVEARSAAEALGTPWFSTAVDLLAGEISAAADDRLAAEASYHDALARAVKHDFGGVGAEALERLGQLAVESDSLAEGSRLLGAAARLRRELGTLTAGSVGAPTGADPVAWAEGQDLPLVEAAAYAARARATRRRPAAGWSALTPMELQVVDLIAQGLTNAQVAERLFITVATTKTHVHHVFGKLGITNRTALAAAALSRAAAEN